MQACKLLQELQWWTLFCWRGPRRNVFFCHLNIRPRRKLSEENSRCATIFWCILLRFWEHTDSKIMQNVCNQKQKKTQKTAFVFLLPISGGGVPGEGCPGVPGLPPLPGGVGLALKFRLGRASCELVGGGSDSGVMEVLAGSPKGVQRWLGDKPLHNVSPNRRRGIKKKTWRWVPRSQQKAFLLFILFLKLLFFCWLLEKTSSDSNLQKL